MIEFLFAALGALVSVGTLLLLVITLEEANNWWNYRR